MNMCFTDDLLWISSLQCSDCYRQQCFSQAVKAELPSPLSTSVTPPCHALVSLQKKKWINVSFLTKPSAALNMRVILVEIVICRILHRERETHSTTTYWIHKPAGSLDVACLKAEA